MPKGVMLVGEVRYEIAVTRPATREWQRLGNDDECEEVSCRPLLTNNWMMRLKAAMCALSIIEMKQAEEEAFGIQVQTHINNKNNKDLLARDNASITEILDYDAYTDNF